MMPLRSRRAIAVVFALLVAACDQDATAPSRSITPRLATVVSRAPVAGQLVLFNGSVPSTFTTQVAALGGKVMFAHSDAGVALVSGLSATAALQLTKVAGVTQVESDHSVALSPVRVSGAMQGAVRASSIGDPAGAAFYSSEWHMRAIGANAAWAAGALGSSNVRVAILDTGIDYANPDLDGLVDQSRSISFVPSDDQLVASNFPGKKAITDLNIHGTHVASTVSSRAGLTAGVTSKVKLMAVKVLDVNGLGTVGTTLSGILWATDHEADVINLSLDGSFQREGAGRLVAIVNRVLNYAYKRGVTVVVASGNSALDLDADKTTFETYCDGPNVVCVSATGPTFEASSVGPWTQIDAFAPYSNFGRDAISVAAPGGNYSPVWGACSTTSLILPFCSFGGVAIGLVGTSMAVPHVSGLAALLVERLGRDPQKIRKRIEGTADDLGPKGRDAFFGRGRINVKTALEL